MKSWSTSKFRSTSVWSIVEQPPSSSSKKLSVRRVQRTEIIDVEMITDDNLIIRIPTNTFPRENHFTYRCQYWENISSTRPFHCGVWFQTRRRIILPKCTPLKTTRMHQRDTPLERNSQPALMKNGTNSTTLRESSYCLFFLFYTYFNQQNQSCNTHDRYSFRTNKNVLSKREITHVLNLAIKLQVLSTDWGCLFRFSIDHTLFHHYYHLQIHSYLRYVHFLGSMVHSVVKNGQTLNNRAVYSNDIHCGKSEYCKEWSEESATVTVRCFSRQQHEMMMFGIPTYVV